MVLNKLIDKHQHGSLTVGDTVLKLASIVKLPVSKPRPVTRKSMTFEA